MNRFLFPILISQFLVLSAFAQFQAPDTLWTRIIGGDCSDKGYCVQQTSDSGFIITGETFSYGAGNSDVVLLKTDYNGFQQWLQTFGGANFDKGSCVQQTTEGGYIIGGTTNSFGPGNNDLYLLKTDSDGILMWQHNFGGQYQDEGNWVVQTADGGFAAVGSIFNPSAEGYNVYLIKTDTNGNLEWQREYGISFDDRGYCLQETQEGGFIIVGYCSMISPYEGKNVYLLRTDDDGNLLWYRTFGGQLTDKGYSVQETADGGFIIAGISNSINPNNNDMYLIKTDAGGNQQWYQTFGGPNEDYAKSVQQTSDGGYVVAGYKYVGSHWNVCIVKTDDSGDSLWQMTTGASCDDFGECIRQTFDNGYIVAGYRNYYNWSNYDICLIRLEGIPNVNIILTPRHTPIQIPANGGYFLYGLDIVNNYYSQYMVDVWSKVLAPNGEEYPLLERQSIVLPALNTISYDYMSQYVKSTCPAGNYIYSAFVRDNSTFERVARDTFLFEKLADDSPGKSNIDPEFLNAGEQVSGSITSSLSSNLFRVHPNPFNQNTRLTFSLAQADKIVIAVFNLQGREIAELLNDYLQPGAYEFNFNATGLNSGVYFISFQSGTGTEIRKAALIK